MRAIGIGAVLALAAWRPASSEAPESVSLLLSCEGRATFVRPNLDWDAEKQRYGEDKRIDTAGRLGLRIDDGAVKVRLPSGVPGGGSWREADRVEITPEKITGRVSRDRFTVDRRTGDIEMSGSISFSGNCEKAPDASAPTKF